MYTTEITKKKFMKLKIRVYLRKIFDNKDFIIDVIYNEKQIDDPFYKSLDYSKLILGHDYVTYIDFIESFFELEDY